MVLQDVPWGELGILVLTAAYESTIDLRVLQFSRDGVGGESIDQSNLKSYRCPMDLTVAMAADVTMTVPLVWVKYCGSQMLHCKGSNPWPQDKRPGFKSQLYHLQSP